MTEEIYGTDYCSDGSVTASGDISLVSGYSNARQSIRNQLLTRVGTYPSIDSDYGSRVFEILGEDITSLNLQTLVTYIRNALLEQPRVQSINSITPFISVDKKVKCNIIVTLVDESVEELNITIEEN